MPGGLRPCPSCEVPVRYYTNEEMEAGAENRKTCESCIAANAKNEVAEAEGRARKAAAAEAEASAKTKKK